MDYVPRGYVPLLDCVDQIAERLEPDIVARPEVQGFRQAQAFEREFLLGNDDWTFRADGHRSDMEAHADPAARAAVERYIDARARAVGLLRDALVEGELSADLLIDSGEFLAITRASIWASREGGRAFNDGRLYWSGNTTYADELFGMARPWEAEGWALLRIRQFDKWLMQRVPNASGQRSQSPARASAADTAFSTALSTIDDPEQVQNQNHSSTSDGKRHWTKAVEARLQEWLTKMMSASPDAPISKKDMGRIARSDVCADYKWNRRGFERAWQNAIKEPGCSRWSQPGRKRKIAAVNEHGDNSKANAVRKNRRTK